MISFRYVATAAIPLTVLIVSYSRTKGSLHQTAGSQTSTAALTARETVKPPTLSSTTSPARPVSESAPQFSGEVSRGQRFEKAVAPGMIFRLEPYAGGDSGWAIRLAPDTESSPASIDCIGAISVPSHGSNDASIELPEGEELQGATLRSPHEFDFVPVPADCKRAWDLNNALAYTYNLTDKQGEELDGKLSRIPTSHGQLKVLDFRLGAQSPTEKPRPIEWIKFEV
jgi:hypothetical protein